MRGYVNLLEVLFQNVWFPTITASFFCCGFVVYHAGGERMGKQTPFFFGAQQKSSSFQKKRFLFCSLINRRSEDDIFLYGEGEFIFYIVHTFVIFISPP